jgi:hypothetical protein
MCENFQIAAIAALPPTGNRRDAAAMLAISNVPLSLRIA